jgi:hypothetical protein
MGRSGPNVAEPEDEAEPEDKMESKKGGARIPATYLHCPM